MNVLSVGLNKTPLRDYLNGRVLVVDDGPFIEQNRSHFRSSREFDVREHSFNPLFVRDHKKVRDIAEIFYAADPGGENTLTVRNGKRALAKLLLSADRLDRVKGDIKDPYQAEALAVLDTVLFSPTVRRVLTGPQNFRFTVKNEGKKEVATVLLRLDRAELGDYDAFIIGNLAMLEYPGQEVITDFGFYGRKGHASLIRQNRLVAGVNFLDEVPHLANHLLSIPLKLGSHSIPKDAEILAMYEGKMPGTDGFSTRVQQLIKAARGTDAAS